MTPEQIAKELGVILPKKWTLWRNNKTHRGGYWNEIAEFTDPNVASLALVTAQSAAGWDAVEQFNLLPTGANPNEVGT